MPADSSTSPTDAIVRITDTIGGLEYQGSGVLISPDEVLTAAHVVWSATMGAASDIVVTPGYESGTAPFGSADGISVLFNPVNDSGDLLSFAQSQSDYAVIRLSTSFGITPMAIDSGFTEGDATVSGYPAVANGALVSRTEAFTQEPGYTLLTAGGLGSGSSGGPVWFAGADGQTDVAATVSTQDGSGAGYFNEITPNVLSTIDSWVEQEGGIVPSVAIPPQDGMSATPLSATDQENVSLADSFGQQVGAASMTFTDGVHVGADFTDLGASAAAGQNAGPFNNQLLSDLKALLSDWNAAQPGITSGISTPGGPTVTLPGQFVANVVTIGLNTIVGGAGPADISFGNVLSNFFATDQSLLLNHTA